MTRPVRHALAFGLGLAVLLPAVAGAQNMLPHRKAGMWETTMNVAGHPMVMGMCTDESVEARYSALNPRQNSTHECAPPAVSPIPGGMHVEMSCKSQSTTIHTVSTVTGDFNKGYSADVVSEINGKAGPPVHMSAKYLGPCPAGRKPGDMVMPGGMVMNVNSMPGMGK
jgi:hypothetical protein